MQNGVSFKAVKLHSRYNRLGVLQPDRETSSGPSSCVLKMTRTRGNGSVIVDCHHGDWLPVPVHGYLAV